MCSKNSVNLSELLTKMWIKFSARAFSMWATVPVHDIVWINSFIFPQHTQKSIHLTNTVYVFKFFHLFTDNSFLEHADNIQTYLPSYIFWSTSGSTTEINIFLEINTTPVRRIKERLCFKLYIIKSKTWF